MAAINRDVLALLAPLQEEGLLGLAGRAIERIESAEAARSREDTEAEEDVDPFAPSPSETGGERRERQLRIADAVVMTILDREIALFKATASALAQLREGARVDLLDDGFAVETIEVVDFGEGDRLSVELTDVSRLEALAELRRWWSAAVTDARGRGRDDVG